MDGMPQVKEEWGFSGGFCCLVPFAFGVEKAEPVWRSQHLRRGPSTKYSLTGGWTLRMVEAATSLAQENRSYLVPPAPAPRLKDTGREVEILNWGNLMGLCVE